MKVKDIQIDGFGVWSNLSVDSLPDTMTLFYGPNEAGKTTLMQFLRAMFYGFTPDRRGRYMHQFTAVLLADRCESLGQAAATKSAVIRMPLTAV